MESKLFDKALKNGLTTGDWSMVNEWIIEYSSFSYNFGPTEGSSSFNQKVFTRILNLLSDKEFVSNENSSIVLSILEYDWSIFSDKQKVRLLPALESAYPDLVDWKAKFLIAKLLGDYLSDQKALHALTSMCALDDNVSRTAAVMGLHYLAAKDNQGEQLVISAYAAISQLKDDFSEVVRAEAERALYRIGEKKST